MNQDDEPGVDPIPIEDLVAYRDGTLDAATRDAIERRLARSGRERAELALIDDALAVDRNAVVEAGRSDALRARLRARTQESTPPVRRSHAPRTRARRAWTVALGTAAVLAVFVGIQRTLPSDSPEPGVESGIRSTNRAFGISVVSTDAEAIRVEWSAPEGAVSYRVEWLDGQGAVLHSQRIEQTAVEFAPLDAGDGSGRALFVRVTALDTHGDSIARHTAPLSGS